MAKKSGGKPNEKRPNFLEGEFSLPKVEESVLKFWDERKIFEKSLDKKNGAAGKGAKGKEFVFYEGPPTANGHPGVHHILSRAFKDIVPRYKTMQGFHVPRKAGWDTHGLPVEIQVEKKLGLSSKKDIEKYGIAAFNAQCRESVWEFKDEWERMTKRMGFWLDMKHPYVTYEVGYMETLWQIIAQFWKSGMLYKGHRVVPWCTRCGTALSSHELAQGYKEVTDNSAYVKFHLKPDQQFGKYKTKEAVYILSWTTTPWTLPGNVALAVGEKISYAAVRVRGLQELYIVASNLAKAVFKGQEIEFIHNDIEGRDLVGLEYEPLFDVKPLQSEKSYRIYPADFVTTTDGTGVVHTAVMYGEDDYELGKKIGLPEKHTVAEDGTFTADVVPLSGMYAKSKTTESKIFQHLEDHGTLLRVEPYKHEYPHCWRCGTPILYYARTSWFVGMSKLRAELLKRNKGVNWIPEHVRDGRFGEWLKEAKDWNFSRERYWGTPLPIWECRACKHTEVVGNLDELDELALRTGPENHFWAMRHGQSFGNEFGIIDSGNQKFRLTAGGRREVAVAARKLKGKKIDVIFASDLERAKESAAIVAEALGVSTIHYDARLHEIFLASLSGTKLEEYRKTLPLHSTPEGRLDQHAVPGAESLKDVRARAWSFLAEVEKKYRGKNILIVSHEDTIWMLEQAALGWSDQKAMSMKEGGESVFIRPGGIVTFDVRRIPRDTTGEADMHRPFVDRVALGCPKCGKEMRRVLEVADVWFDSGSMPFAQDEHEKVDVKKLKGLDFPADYISEAVDQTRGWFYTLLAVATALGYGAPYRNVICLGHINDKNGQKMSKSKGNIVDPWAMMSTYGVDAVRWYFYTATPPGEPKNFDEQEVLKVSRKVHLIIYNSFLFWKTYGVSNANFRVPKTKSHILDAWISARLDEAVDVVTGRLDKYEIREAGLAIESLVDDLSRWYIRRSRRRFQRPENKKDHEAASATLNQVLLALVKLMAPFTPFFSESLYGPLGGTKESVHLDAWPKARVARGKARTAKLTAGMKTVRDFAAKGLAKRAEIGIKVRQPLASMTVPAKLPKELQQVLADEMNVKKIITDLTMKDAVVLDVAITPALREEGLVREVSRMVQELRQKAELSPKDKIVLMIQADERARDALTKNEATLKSDVGAQSLEYKKSEKFSAEIEAKIENQKIWIGIRKI